MSASTTTPPSDPGQLARWLLARPKARITKLRKHLHGAGADRFTQLQPGVRVALHEAWDEDPETFFELLEPWRKGRNTKFRALYAAALPMLEEPAGARCRARLLELAADRSRDVRLVAVERLCRELEHIPVEAARFARDRDPGIRELVARGLAELGPVAEFREVFLAVCLDRNVDVHWAAAAALPRVHERDESLARELGQLMAESDDIDIRWAVAVNYLEPLFAEQFERIVPTLRQWVRTGDRSLKWTLVHSLRFVPSSPRLTALLRLLFEDRDPVIRRRVLWQLGQLVGKVERSEVAALLDAAAGDGSRKVREQAERTEQAFREQRRLDDEDEDDEEDEDEDDSDD